MALQIGHMSTECRCKSITDIPICLSFSFFFLFWMWACVYIRTHTHLTSTILNTYGDLVKMTWLISLLSFEISTFHPSSHLLDLFMRATCFAVKWVFNNFLLRHTDCHEKRTTTPCIHTVVFCCRPLQFSHLFHCLKTMWTKWSLLCPLFLVSGSKCGLSKC